MHFFYEKSLLACLCLISLVCRAQENETTVFQSGQDGHKIYRIPAIIAAPNGDLLAFCEGRVHGENDFGDINIVQKRSKDGGKTWSTLQTLVDYDHLQAGNPAPVVDLLDPRFPAGRIFLFYNTGNNHENEVRKGNGLREAWYITSTDNGHTWSAAVNITLQVHRPRQPLVNAAYHFEEDWRSYANTPGHAVQFKTGKYRGRLFIAANHSAGDPQPASTDYQAHGYYSDDHGNTFRISENIPVAGSNEAMAATLEPNRLLMTIRNQKGEPRYRIMASSPDGGHTWDNTYFDSTLTDAICQGSIINLGTRNGKDILAVCNATDTSRRDNLVLRISYTGGTRWQRAIVIAKAPADFKGDDYAAYSDLVKMPQQFIGVLFEKMDYSKIVFTRVRWQ